jgi:myo-inositol 2-dehydrogenase/D-chiro-inositol 1-dehydrogenase
MSVRVGVIGCGVMGAHHARTLAHEVSGAEVAAVSDADQARAAATAEESGGARVHADGLALIRDPQVDAVLIASPDATHTPLTLACIAEGKPVLCEKPLGISTEECRSVIRAEIDAKQRLVWVGFMRRFDPGYRDMRKAAETETYGLPLFLHCIHRNKIAPDYLTSDLIIANSAIHEMDIGRFILGEDFIAATVISPRSTRMAPNRQPQLLVLESASGVVMDVEAFVDARYGYEVRAELVCEEGTVSLLPAPPVSIRHEGHDGIAVHDNWVPRFLEAYRVLLQSWVSGMGGGSRGAASAWDGYVAQKTAESCLMALRTRTRVAIDREDRPLLYQRP